MLGGKHGKRQTTLACVNNLTDTSNHQSISLLTVLPTFRTLSCKQLPRFYVLLILRFTCLWLFLRCRTYYYEFGARRGEVDPQPTCRACGCSADRASRRAPCWPPGPAPGRRDLPACSSAHARTSSPCRRCALRSQRAVTDRRHRHRESTGDVNAKFSTISSVSVPYEGLNHACVRNTPLYKCLQN